jgi:tRNA(Ile2) C34 agmatinyltransferase TiaS
VPQQKPRRRQASNLKGRILDYQPAQRSCLFCGKTFNSQGPGNRKCEKCRAKG